MAAEEKSNIYVRGLNKVPANYQPQTPISFILWAGQTYRDKVGVIHGGRRITYGEMLVRCRKFSSALKKRGIKKGDTVAILAPNIPALLEAHFAVPMAGAVLNPLNIRLDPETIAFILNHGEAKLLIADREWAAAVEGALKELGRDLPVIRIDDDLAEGGADFGEIEYEAFLDEGDPDHEVSPPDDEWDPICLLYTSGTTGNPKGVVYHHRGAFLNGLGNALVSRLGGDSTYLWTLPMFHCSGWTFTWGATAVGATHVCLRKADPALIFPMIRDHKVTHMCGAPIVLTMLIHAPEEQKVAFPQTVECFTGGAAPPSAVISGMEKMGFHVVHLYGLTESYGPSTFCAWKDEWKELDSDAKAEMMARQGVRYPTLSEQDIIDPETMEPAPADGETIGELMLRGHTIMKGYLKNREATDAAFKGGWFHTGDLGVKHPDGYVEIKDRSKDIIISGGENISSLEVEDVLFKHPDIMEAAVVAKPDEKWGETPCAFVTAAPGKEDALTADAVIVHCRENMAAFKAPKTVVFGPLPKTSTGKIQKFVLRERAKEF